jgi:flagellar basal-body rod modification protein FlgD
MVEEVKKQSDYSDLVGRLNQQSNTEKNESSKQAEKSTEKEDFLKILVSQLENQDPLNPMDNDRFAVDLAQFSQLEQLINLNETLSNNGDVGSSLAQYLGNEVSWEANQIELSSDANQILNLTSSTPVKELNIELINDVGSVVDTIKLTNLEAGKNEFNLAEYSKLRGEFALNVSAIDENNTPVDVKKEFSGTVTGFIPSAESTLLIGDKEIRLDQITRVSTAEEASTTI